MSKKYTPLDIDRLNREAKRLARAAGIPLYEALRMTAIQQGFGGWELLMRSVAKVSLAPTSSKLKPSENGSIGHQLTDHITNTCIQFIKTISDEDVFRACWNGSIWISVQDVQNGEVAVGSFTVLGPGRDSYWSSIGQSMGMACLLSLDGLAECFILEEDVDDDGNSIEPNDLQDFYSPETGRAKLIEVAGYSIESDVEELELALLNQEE